MSIRGDETVALKYKYIPSLSTTQYFQQRSKYYENRAEAQHSLVLTWDSLRGTFRVPRKPCAVYAHGSETDYSETCTENTTRPHVVFYSVATTMAMAPAPSLTFTASPCRSLFPLFQPRPTLCCLLPPRLCGPALLAAT